VFFVDPMPGLIWGTAAIEDVVGPIVRRGHDVQLHIHTEWLELTGSANPVGRTGTNIADFNLDEQCNLLDRARSLLVAAGAPLPRAFRAGNYGANDDTLRALAILGLSHDSSHCPGFAGTCGRRSLTAADRATVERCGVIEVPIGCIAGPGDRRRHAQVTAISANEIIAALAHCRRRDISQFTLVSHSFELLSRDRTRINEIVRRRFANLCRQLGAMPGVTTGTYAANPPGVESPATSIPLLPFNPLRAGWRIAEQAVSNAMYGTR